MNNDINIHYKILTPNEVKEKKEILEGLKNLWIETFGDSREYIDLLYDTYIDDALIGVAMADNDSMDSTETAHNEGDIIGALTAIPYRFKEEPIKEREEETYCAGDILTLREPSGRENAPANRDIIRGWYLCGLATIPNLRGRNIMGNLMRMSEEAIKKMGDRLLFLIPADDRLALYYERKGFVAGMKRSSMFLPKIERRTFSGEIGQTNDYFLIGEFKRSRNNKNCDSDYSQQFDYSQQIEYSEVRFSELNDSEREEIVKYLMNREEAENIGIGLIHSKKDWVTILRENEISEGKIFISKISNSHRITSVAFTNAVNHSYFSNEEPSEEKDLEIRCIVGDSISKCRLIEDMRKRSNVILYFYYEQDKELVELIPISEQLFKDAPDRYTEANVSLNLPNAAEEYIKSERKKRVQENRYLMIKILDKRDSNYKSILNHKIIKSENSGFEICELYPSKFLILKNEQSRETASKIEEGRVNATLLLD